MRTLVTGGGGFLGRYVVEQLQSRGDDVRVFSRGAYPDLVARGVQVVRGDLQDASAVSDACRDIEAVFHVAAVPGIWGRWSLYYGVNTIGSRNVLKGCQQHGVERLIYTSSPSVVFDGADHVDADETLPYPRTWLCHYPHSKALAEQEILQANGISGLKTIALRPHLIWGKRDNHLIPRLLQKARSGRLRKVGDGRNRVSMINVENAAAAHLQAEQSLRSDDAAAAGRAYFINEAQAVNLWDWINDILQRAGIQPVRKSISMKAAYRIGRVMEVLYRMLPGEPPITRFVALQLATSHVYSISNAKRDFGFQPVVSVEDGMDKMMADFQTRG